MSEIPQYVKKSVIIEALQWTGDNDEHMAEFMGVAFLLKDGDEKILIDTLEGPLYASLGDFIIRGVKGEYYPCKPDVFALSYDKV